MTAAASMAQVNVRMSPELKTAGEAAMSACGFTPTEVLRWVYQTFAEGRDGIARLLQEGTMARADETVSGPGDSDGASFLRGIDERYRAAYHSLGLNPHAPALLTCLTDDELDRRAWDDRDRERGLGEYAD